ncbi:MAG: hypothetical protein ACK58N_08575 [Synechocystis sp.]
MCKLAPYANKTIAITWAEAKQAIGNSKATFYRSLRQFTTAGLLISHKIAGFCVSLKNETTVSEMKIESQNCDSQSQNCDSSLYKEFKILSEGESAKKTENPSEPASKTVSQDSLELAKVNQTSTVSSIDILEEKFSAAARTKKQTKDFNWLPEGPWNIEGKLDPNFRDWLAQDWQALYGGTIHQKRADVLTHFKKDPANLAIRWEQYRSEFLDRVQNTQILLSQGVAVKPETQELLLTNQRALTAELPAEMNPVAPMPEARFAPANQTIASLTEEVTAVAALPGPKAEAQELKASAPAHAESQEPQAQTPSKKSEEVSTEDGKRLPVFQRQGVTEQGRSEKDDRDPGKLRSMVNAFLKGFGGGQTPSKKPQAQTQLEKLNSWLHDPALRENTIAFVNRSESFKYCPLTEEIIHCEEF